MVENNKKIVSASPQSWWIRKIWLSKNKEELLKKAAALNSRK